MEPLRITRCEIDLDKLRRNIETLRQQMGPDVDTMAIIKADGYGHGACVMMKYMLKYGVRHFGVATLNEGLELRRQEKDGNVLILGLTPDSLLHYCVEHGLEQTVVSYRQAKILSDLGKNARIQIKFDSGMHRIGYPLTEEAMDEVGRIAALPGVTITGVYTHLALKDAESDALQFERFQQFVAGCEARGARFPLKHVCDGNGAIKYPHMRLDMVRPGAFFYGWNSNTPSLEPIMTMKSEIVQLRTVPAGEGIGYGLREAEQRDRVIATLPFGYIDGVPRALSFHRGWVGVRGQRAPIVSLMCMDMCMVDVTDIPGVTEGDEVTVFSQFDGGMSYQEAANLADFNRNGLQAAPSRRVPKIYFENGEIVETVDYLL